MKTKARITIAGLLAAAAFTGTSAFAYDLQDSMVSAYQYNNQLKAQQSQLLSTHEQIPQAYSEFMPQAVMNGNLKRQKSQNLLTSEVAAWNNENEHDFTLVQPIFNGGQSISRVKRAYDAVAAATSDLESSEEQLMINVIAAHMDVVRAKVVADLSRTNEDALKKQLDSSRERLKLGEATKTDVAQSEARYSRAMSDRISAEGALEVALSNLTSISGDDVKSMINNPLNFNLPNIKMTLPNTLDEALDIAFKNNPTLNSQIYQEKIGEHDVSIAYSQLAPSVSLRGTISRDKDSFKSADLPLGNIRDNEQSLVLSLSLPLYQGGAEYSRIREAKQNHETLKHQVDIRKDQLRYNITKAWQDIATAHASIKTTTDAVNAAKSALDGVKKEQQVGSRTILDVLDAEQEYYQEMINLISAQRNEIVALYNLKFHLGQLTVKTLELPVKAFDSEGHLSSTKFKMIGF